MTGFFEGTGSGAQVVPHNLDAHIDVTIQLDTLTDGQILKYNATQEQWQNIDEVVDAIQYFPVDDLKDVSAPTPLDGQALTWVDVNSQWEAVTITAGAPINLNDVLDVTIDTPTNGDRLEFSGGVWVNVSGSNTTNNPVTIGDGADVTNAGLILDSGTLVGDSSYIDFNHNAIKEASISSNSDGTNFNLELEVLNGGHFAVNSALVVTSTIGTTSLPNTNRVMKVGPFGILAETTYNEDEVVLTRDDQTIAGTKTFSNSIQVNEQIGCSSIAAGNLTTGGRILRVGAFGLIEQSGNSVSDFVTLTGNQTISGFKDFVDTVSVGAPPVTPTVATPLAVDGNIYMNATSGTGVDIISNFGTLQAKSSDARLKQNIAGFINGLDAVMALKPSTFEWISNGLPDSGFIAQEVHDVLPEAVPENPDGMLGLRELPIIAALVKAVQEQQEQINELKALETN